MIQSKTPVDQDIISLHREGNREEAIKLLIQLYQDRIYSLSYKVLNNHDDTLDALQEIYIQIDKSLPDFRGDSQLYTWIYRLTLNVCINFKKKRKKCDKMVELSERVIQPMINLISRPVEDPDKLCEEKYQQLLFQKALTNLQESQRIPIILHDLERIKLSEISNILNLPLNTIKTRLYRGRESLKSHIHKLSFYHKD